MIEELTDPYFSTNKCIDRLKEQYDLHKKLIIGFDFDDTIFDFHKKGYTYDRVITLLKKCNALRFPLVMISCKETQEQLDDNCFICKQIDIKVDYVNCSPVMPKASKPFVNILLDDKAGLRQAYDILNTVVTLIEGENK